MKINKRRKNRMISKLCIFMLALVCLVSVFVIIGKSSANASENRQEYYASICVESGDTLTGIAAEYNMSVKEIKKLNNLKSNTIYAGESLIVTYTK